MSWQPPADAQHGPHPRGRYAGVAAPPFSTLTTPRSRGTRRRRRLAPANIPPPYGASPDPALWRAIAGVFIGHQPPESILGGVTPQPPVQHQPPSQAQTQKQPTQQPKDNDWKEYKTAEGRIFWHSSKSNRSTWEKPDELRTDLERIIATSTHWKEYPQGDDKSYWHNSLTKESEWEVPGDVATIRASNEALDNEDWTGRKLEGKSDARAQFREFLERRCVGHMATWDSIGKILMKDPKWAVFNSLLTAGERKHIFNEHVNNLIKKNKDDLRIKKSQARDDLSDYLTKWKNGHLPNKPKMPADAVFDDLEDKAEWRLLDLRERFETFEEVAASVAANAIQKCTSQKADQLTRWFRAVKDAILPQDSSLEEVLQFTRKYYDGDLEDVNDLSIIQQWKSLITNKLQGSPSAKVREAFNFEKELRNVWRQFLDDCEREGILNAKTEWQDFLRQPVPLPYVLEENASIIPKSSVSEVAESKRLQSLAKLTSNVKAYLDDRADNTDDSYPVCFDQRYLLLHLQGGSSPKELFDDMVYSLWDLYEIARDDAKNQMSTGEITKEEEMEKWVGELAPKFQRPGVITPLRQYCRKRLQPKQG